MDWGKRPRCEERRSLGYDYGLCQRYLKLFGQEEQANCIRTGSHCVVESELDLKHSMLYARYPRRFSMILLRALRSDCV